MSPNCIAKIRVIGHTTLELWYFNSGYLRPNRVPKMRFLVPRSQSTCKNNFFSGGIDRPWYHTIIFGKGRFWVKRCGLDARLSDFSLSNEIGSPSRKGPPIGENKQPSESKIPPLQVIKNNLF